MEEILRAGDAVRAVAEALGRPAAKLNVGQLGNVTPQLHVHVIAPPPGRRGLAGAGLGRRRRRALCARRRWSGAGGARGRALGL